MYWLDILNGPARGRRKIHRRSLVIGSDLTCHFWVDAPGVAPRHAEIVERAGAVMLRRLARAPSDLLKLNGEIVTTDRLLSDGDTIEIAGVRIRYRSRLPWMERCAPALRWVVPLALALGGGGWAVWRWWSTAATVPPGAEAAALSEAARVVTPQTPPPGGLLISELSTAATSSPVAAAETAGREAEPVELPRPTPAPPAEPALAALPLSSTGVTTRSATVDTVRLAGPTETSSPAALVVSDGGRPAVPEAARRSPYELQVKAAEALAEAGAWERAARAVEGVPREDPAFPRVLMIRARAAEQAGRFRDAEALWTDVLRLGSDSPFYETAFQELVRLAERQVSLAPPPLLERAASVTGAAPTAPTAPDLPPSVLAALRAPRPQPPAEPPAPPAAPVPVRGPGEVTARDTPATGNLVGAGGAVGRPPGGQTAAVATVVGGTLSGPTPAEPVRTALRTPATTADARPRFTVRKAELTRFPPDTERDEVRVLNLQLQLDGVREPLPLDQLQVDVAFFDRRGDPPRVFRSRVAQGSRRFNLTGEPWQPGEVRQLSFSYLVPRGARERDGSAFHGYRVRVFHRGQTVLETARPADLEGLD
ncbi:MAG: FHA domain-containing protein [Kiritimatiellae bacterium]|nr:FHA domain-containing protein [Kiritimatiellia bacterium]